MKKVFVIAGEKSGDLIGGKILKHFDRNEVEFYGVGDIAMEKEGLKSIFPMNDLAVMGVFEVLPKLFKILKRIRQTVKAIVELQPDILITIDSPDFCFRVVKKVKNKLKNTKIIHFVAPSVWMYREKRGEKIAKLYDLLLCILPFEPPYFERYGLKTRFVGHPFFYKDSTEYKFNTEDVVYSRNSDIISITVGSRISEVKRFLPMVLRIIKKLRENFDLKYYFLATENTFPLLNMKIMEADDIKIVKNETEKQDVIKNSLLGLVKSGTNALEFAGFSIPIVVYYKFNLLTNFLAKHIRKKSKINFANLVNIVANREIVPEFTIENCLEDKIYDCVNNLLKNEGKRIKQIIQTKEILRQLGCKNDNFSSDLIVKEIKNA